MAILLGDNVRVTLASPVTAGATSITVNVGVAPFRSPVDTAGGHYAYLTLVDNLVNPTKLESVTYAGWTDNGNGTITLSSVSRGQDGTSAQSWSSGDYAFQAVRAAWTTLLESLRNSKAQASGLASLDGSSKVVQDPANATATPTASKIPIAGGGGTLASGWIPDLSGTYAVAAKGVTNGDSHDHSGGDGAQIYHTTLADKGTNTHAQIDSHLSATAAHGISGAVVGTTDAQTLSSKTLGGALAGNNQDVNDLKVADFYQEVNNATSTGAVTVNWTNGAAQKQVEPTGTITYTFTAPPGPARLQLRILSDGASTSQTINWPASVKWLSAAFTATVANKNSIVTFWYDGTNYWGMAATEV